jgi:hypothetical protein
VRPKPSSGAVEATTDEITSELREALKEADMVDMHLEVDISPRVRRRPVQAVLPAPGLAARRRRRPAGRPSHRPVHAPGSAASVTFGTGLTAAAPGSAEGGLTVADIEAAHDELVGRGIDASEIWHGPPFPVEARQPGPDPDRTSYGSFCSFTDPDGNIWLVQEVTTRLPGRAWDGIRIHGGPRQRTHRVRVQIEAAHSDPICMLRPVIAEHPPTAQSGGSARVLPGQSPSLTVTGPLTPSEDAVGRLVGRVPVVSLCDVCFLSVRVWHLRR